MKSPKLLFESRLNIAAPEGAGGVPGAEARPDAARTKSGVAGSSNRRTIEGHETYAR